MLGQETVCAAKNCGNHADAYGNGTLHTVAVGKPTKFYAEIWLCPEHSKKLKS